MHFLKGFSTALIGAVAVNLIILFLFRPFVTNSAMPLHALSVGPVTMLTVLGVIAATIVYALMRLLLANPNVPFVWLSGIVLLISFIPDYQIIGQTTGMFAGGTISSALTLMLMHLAAAVIIVWSLVKLWGERASKPAV
jgi:hypothetical protein